MCTWFWLWNQWITYLNRQYLLYHLAGPVDKSHNRHLSNLNHKNSIIVIASIFLQTKNLISSFTFISFHSRESIISWHSSQSSTSRKSVSTGWTFKNIIQMIDKFYFALIVFFLKPIKMKKQFLSYLLC